MLTKKRRVSPTFDNPQKQEYLYTGPNHAANLNDMRLKDKYCDVTIKVNGKEIRAHKVILAANLKYFETMFSSDSFQESHDAHDGVITMESVEKADLELFVSYAYTGEILLTESNALNLLELANYLSEDGIKEACVEFLEKFMKTEEACRTYKFANTIDCPLLKNAAKAKIITNYGICSESTDYLNFDSESLMDILSDGKDQSIQMQKILFEGTMGWIMHDAKNRKIYLKDLLSAVDITKLTSDDVVSCLYKNTVRQDEYGITNDTIIYYKTNKNEQRIEEQVLIILDNAAFYQFYNFIENKWSSRQKISGAAQNISQFCAVLNKKLYYLNKSSEETHLQVFDPSSNQNRRLHPPSTVFECATLCACSRFLYICGGIKPNKSRSDQILRYDPQTNSFKTLTPMRMERSSVAAIFYQGCLHVLGGSDGSSVYQSVEKYDPVTNGWVALAPMCKKRRGHALAVLDGKLYACGGYSTAREKSSVEVYDPATNSWHLVASMKEGRGYFLLVAHKDKLFAIGGGAKKKTEVYDPIRNEWQMDDEMSSGLQTDCRVGGLIPSSCITNTQR